MINQDLHYIHGICAGDTPTLRLVYKEFRPYVVGFVKQHSGNKEDGEDVFQRVLLALMGKPCEPNFELTVKLSTFITAIAKNLWYKQARTKTRIHFTEEEIDAVEKAFINLPQEDCKRQRQLLYCKYFDQLNEKDRNILNDSLSGMTGEELAVKYGHDRGYVNVALSRIRKWIKENMENDFLFPELKSCMED